MVGSPGMPAAAEIRLPEAGPMNLKVGLVGGVAAPNPRPPRCADAGVTLRTITAKPAARPRLQRLGNTIVWTIRDSRYWKFIRSACLQASHCPPAITSHTLQSEMRHAFIALVGVVFLAA